MEKKVDIIKTERLILRGIKEEDAEDIVKWRSEPGVFKYLKSPHQITLSEHIEWYHSTYLYDMTRFDWIALEGKMKIGVFGLVIAIDGNDSSNIACVEVNYLLAPNEKHKGYATEAVKALIQYAKTTWNVKQIIVEIHKNNKPSIKLAEKIGFNYLKTDGDFLVYKYENKGFVEKKAGV